MSVIPSRLSQTETELDMLRVSIVILSYNRPSEISVNSLRVLTESRSETDFQISGSQPLDGWRPGVPERFSRPAFRG